MGRRDDNDTPRPPTGSGVHRTLRPGRDASTATRTLVEVSVALERLTGRLDQMAALFKEKSEDHERGLHEVRDRVERLVGESSQSWAASQSAIDSMRATMESNNASLVDTLNSFTAFNREDRAQLVEMMKAREAREEARAHREEERRKAAEEREAEERRAEREREQAALARKDQWLQRAWERFKTPMLLIGTAAATVVATLLTRCGGG